MKKVMIAVIAALFACSAHAAAEKQEARAMLNKEECTKQLEGKNAAEQEKFRAEHAECR